MWICVGPRDPSTKPSRDWLRVGVSKPQCLLAATVAARIIVPAKTRAYWRGCGRLLLARRGRVCVQFTIIISTHHSISVTTSILTFPLDMHGRAVRKNKTPEGRAPVISTGLNARYASPCPGLRIRHSRTRRGRLRLRWVGAERRLRARRLRARRLPLLQYGVARDRHAEARRVAPAPQVLALRRVGREHARKHGVRHVARERPELVRTRRDREVRVPAPAATRQPHISIIRRHTRDGGVRGATLQRRVMTTSAEERHRARRRARARARKRTRA